MSSFLRVALVVLAIVAGAVALNVLGPSKPDTDQYTSLTTAALVDAELNETNAEGAPQQAVVNGWVARDLAAIQIQQNNDLLEQQTKTNQILFVGLVVGSLFLATLGGGRRVAEEVAPVPPSISRSPASPASDQAPTTTASAESPGDGPTPTGSPSAQ